MKLIGRVNNVRATKFAYFLDVYCGENVQVVLERERFDKPSINSIIKVDGVEEFSNKYGKSIIAKEMTVLTKEAINNLLLQDVLKQKSAMYNLVRTCLIENGYMEVDLPILMTQNSSSPANEFSTTYDVNGQTLYLRKNLDVFMRLLSLDGCDKIFHIGHCFRNEHITSKNLPEFEMLSIYSNFSTVDEMIELFVKIIKKLNISKSFKEVSYADYVLNKKEYAKTDIIYIITECPINDGTNAKIDLDKGYALEKKIAYKGATLCHSLTEIDNVNEYEDLCNRQNLTKFSGDVKVLHDRLKNGGVPCASIGISLNRILALFNENVKDIKSCESFPFSRIKQQKNDFNR